MGAMNAPSPDWLTPAPRMPWPVSAPFRMRPNLEKLDAAAPALLLRDALAPVYARERERVLRERPERALVGAAHAGVMAAIRDLLPPAEQAIPELALGLQEDFVILHAERDALRTEYLSVCFPSRWDPREKLGLDFAQIHAPVADNAMLLAAGPSIMNLAFMQQPMLRHVWLVVPSASLAQHPDQSDYSWAETLRDPAPLLPRLLFRVERQTTWPLPAMKRAVFFIRVMMCPLLEVLRHAPGRAHALAEALASMTPAVQAYRGMSEAMPRLLAELAHVSR
jgi:dimethylamine monooxygenase subunit A